MALILRVRSMMLFNRPVSTFTNPASAVSKNAGGNTCAITCDMCSCSVMSAASQSKLSSIRPRRLRQPEVEALAMHTDGDVADAGPGVEPGAQCPERWVV